MIRVCAPHTHTYHVHSPTRALSPLTCAEERHCVSLLTDLEFDAYPGYRGAIVDNDKRIGVRMLDDTDRTIIGSRKLFDSLFPFAKEVRITSVWDLVDLAYDDTANGNDTA